MSSPKEHLAFPLKRSALSTSAASNVATQEVTPEVVTAGVWQISWTDANGDSRQGSMQIKQEGANLSGTFQDPRVSAKLTGALQGSHVSINVKAAKRQIAFTGLIDGDKRRSSSS
jgi:hypothetical protein